MHGGTEIKSGCTNGSDPATGWVIGMLHSHNTMQSRRTAAVPVEARFVCKRQGTTQALVKAWVVGHAPIHHHAAPPLNIPYHSPCVYLPPLSDAILLANDDTVATVSPPHLQIMNTSHSWLFVHAFTLLALFEEVVAVQSLPSSSLRSPASTP